MVAVPDFWVGPVQSIPETAPPHPTKLSPEHPRSSCLLFGAPLMGLGLSVPFLWAQELPSPSSLSAQLL